MIRREKKKEEHDRETELRRALRKAGVSRVMV
jgi:hypothetical protein